MRLARHQGPSCRPPPQAAAGFTLVELVSVLLLIGILAAIAIPRFGGTVGFDARGFHDQVGGTLRYARKAAVAQRRAVCVTITATSLTLSQAAAPPPSVACSGALPIPGANGSALTAPAGVTLSPAALVFTALGQAIPASSISVTGDSTVRTLTIEGETGHVH